MTIDAAHATFARLVPEIREALLDKSNEAACRLHAVDRILKEVLGWPAPCIYPEEHTEDGRIDYLLKIEGANRAVIEAKAKDTLWFKTSHTSGKAYRLNGPVFQHDAARSVIEQASTYCAAKRVSLCAATNGTDWIVFQGNRVDGVEVLDGKGFLFLGLEGIEKEFAIFWALLHYEAVRRRAFVGHFADAEQGVERDWSFSRAVVEPHEVSICRPGKHSADLGLVCKKFFRDIAGEGDPKLIENCFVETKESREAERRLERITVNLTGSIKSLGDSTKPLTQAVESALHGSAGEQVLIVGVKGAGKSTFVRRFFERILDEKVRRLCMLLWIDVGSFAGPDSSIGSWLDQAVIRALDESLRGWGAESFDHVRGIFRTEYLRLQKTTLAPLYERDKQAFKEKFGEHIDILRRTDPFTYAATCLGYIARNRQFLPVIVFDNADHFSADVQEAIFQYGVAIGKHKEVHTSLVVVPVTERTLWSRRDTAFASHYSTRFYLPPPVHGKVIESRLKCILHAMDKPKERSPEYVFGVSMSISFEDLYKVIAGLQRALTEHWRFGRTISKLANGNLRSLFDIVERTITSGHLRLEDIVAAQVTGEPEALPYTSLLKALLRGQYKQFRPDDKNYVVNVFDLVDDVRTSPLLAVRMLVYLRDPYLRARERTRHWEADVPVGAFFDYFLDMGVHHDEIAKIADALLERQLIEGDDPTSSSVEGAKTLCATSRGVQHLSWVRGDGLYIEAMAQVSRIHDEDVFDELVQDYGVMPPRFAAIRERFVEYCVNLDAGMYAVPGGERYREQQQIAPFLRSRWSAPKGSVAGRTRAFRSEA